MRLCRPLYGQSWFCSFVVEQFLTVKDSKRSLRVCHFRADLEWSGGAAKAPPCTVGYLAEGTPLETAQCQAATAHSQQLTHDLQEAAADQQQSSNERKKKEMTGAAGASSAACTNILVRIPIFVAGVCFMTPECNTGDEYDGILYLGILVNQMFAACWCYLVIAAEAVARVSPCVQSCK